MPKKHDFDGFWPQKWPQNISFCPLKTKPHRLFCSKKNMKKQTPTTPNTTFSAFEKV
jgi:hypothetical protein